MCTVAQICRLQCYWRAIFTCNNWIYYVLVFFLWYVFSRFLWLASFLHRLSQRKNNRKNSTVPWECKSRFNTPAIINQTKKFPFSKSFAPQQALFIFLFSFQCPIISQIVKKKLRVWQLPRFAYTFLLTISFRHLNSGWQRLNIQNAKKIFFNSLLNSLFAVNCCSK